MKMKSIFFILITLGLVSCASQPQMSSCASCQQAQRSAYVDAYTIAYRAPASNNQPVEPEFHACVNIKVLPYGSTSLDGHTQVMPEVSFWHSRLSDRDQAPAIDFLRKTALRYQDYLGQNLRFLTRLRACYTSNGANCSSALASVDKMLQVLPRRLRHELALSRTAAKIDIIPTADLSDAINSKLESFSLFVPAPVSNLPLTPSEYQHALRSFEKELAQAKKEADRAIAEKKAEKKGWMSGMLQYLSSFTNSYEDFRNAVLLEKLHELHNKHAAEYRDIIYRQAPLFAYLPKAQWSGGTHPQASWSRAQIMAALDALIANATHEVQKTADSLNQNELEFDRVFGGDKPGAPLINPEAFVKGVLGGERDLLHYILMKPVVEEILTENNSYCGLATGLVKHLGERNMQDALGTVAVMIPAIPAMGAAIGVGAGATAATLGTTIALTTAETSAIVGISLGVGFVGTSFLDLNEIKQQTLTYSGASHSEIETQDETAISSAETDVKLNAAFMVFNVGDGAILGKYIFGAAKAGALPQSSRVLLGGINATEEDRSQAVYSSILNLLNRKQASAQETGMWVKFSERFRLDSPRVTPEQHEKWLSALRTFFGQEVKSLADLERLEIAQLVFDKLNPAIVDTWSKDEFEGLLDVFGSVIVELKNAKDSELAALKQGDAVVQNEFLDRALSRSGIERIEERNRMKACAF